MLFIVDFFVGLVIDSLGIGISIVNNIDKLPEESFLRKRGWKTG
ncbi:hypothetical protein [Bacillus sp. EB01]|nr:hypothetical protein [Bacillus sp. EB01]